LRGTQNATMAQRERPAGHGRALLPLGALIAGAVAVRAALTPLYAYLPNGYLDEGFWKDWMLTIHRHGVLNIFRESDTDYVGYHWVLWALAGVYALIGGPYTQTSPSLHVLVKTPSIIFDVALMISVYVATALLARQQARRHGERLALAAAAVIAFQPAVLYDSAVWAQTDAAVTVAMLLSLVLVANGRPMMGWGVWTLGFLVKPHPIVVVPILLTLTLRRSGPTALARGMVAVGAVGAIVLGPWLLHGDVPHRHHLQGAVRYEHDRLSASPEPVVVPEMLPRTRHRTAQSRRRCRYHVSWRRRRVGAISGRARNHARLVASTLRGALVGAAYLAFTFYPADLNARATTCIRSRAALASRWRIERRWLWLSRARLPSRSFSTDGSCAADSCGCSGRWVECHRFARDRSGQRRHVRRVHGLMSILLRNRSLASGRR
jgi:hypothetical protein